MTRSRLRAWAGAAIVTVTFVSTVGPLAGAELRIGYPSDIVSEDPADYRDRWTEILLRNVFDGILTRDPSMRLVPELAESWVQVSPRVYEFRLRSGVRFHHGKPLTAEDVVFSFERLIKPGALGGRDSPRKGLLGPLASITAVDPLTVRFQLDSPWPIFPAMLPFQQIVARREISGAQSGGHGAKTGEWAGSGPFRLVQWFPDDALVFERHEDYFGGATGIPPVGQACVDRIVVNIVPDNESRVAGLLAEDFDIVVDLRPHSIPVLERHPDTEAHVVDGTRSFFLAMNTREPPFDDVRVRRAVAHALDRGQLVRQHLSGRATLIDGILGPNTFGKNQQLNRHGHDKARARALLAEAGYPEGFDVDLDVTQLLFPVAESIGVQLAMIGIRTRTVIGDKSDIGRKWRGGRSGSSGDMWLNSWGGAAMDPVGIFDATHRTGGRGNAAGYSNPSLDAILDAAGAESDTMRRADLYRQAESIVNGELPYVYLWVPQEVYGLTKRVRGFAAAPDGRLNLQDVCIEEPQ